MSSVKCVTNRILTPETNSPYQDFYCPVFWPESGTLLQMKLQWSQSLLTAATVIPLPDSLCCVTQKRQTVTVNSWSIYKDAGCLLALGRYKDNVYSVSDLHKIHPLICAVFLSYSMDIFEKKDAPKDLYHHYVTQGFMISCLLLTSQRRPSETLALDCRGKF